MEETNSNLGNKLVKKIEETRSILARQIEETNLNLENKLKTLTTTSVTPTTTHLTNTDNIDNFQNAPIVMPPIFPSERDVEQEADK